MTGDVSVFGWATVVSVNPLTVRRDGETAPLGVSPFSLVDASLLAVGDRVWIQLVDRRALILGVGGGVRLPYRIATGTITMQVGGSWSAWSLPSGRFSTVPKIYLQVADPAGSATGIVLRERGGHTTTSTFQVHAFDAASRGASTVNVNWLAVQL